jgi:hypothetical protein
MGIPSLSPPLLVSSKDAKLPTVFTQSGAVRLLSSG